MTFLGWLALAGALLLVMALAATLVRRLPVSASLIYLACGIAVGPAWLGWLRIDLVAGSQWFERLTEVAVIVSLFMGGLKLRLPVRDPAWRAAFALAGPVMLACIAAVAVVGHFAFALPWPLAVLLGAVLAPTDPVLASSLTVSSAADRDRLRYGLSGEAGLNDGAAFPFVVFALAWAAQGTTDGWLGAWALERLLWAVPAGLVTGYLLGQLGGRVAIALRRRQRDVESPNDFLALALIALSYAAAEAVHGWGFLAAFAAGVGMRHVEVAVVQRTPHPDHAENGGDPLAHPPAEDLVGGPVEGREMGREDVAAGVVLHDVITFGDTAERLLEVTLVVLVGVALGTHWSPAGALLGLVLFVAIRPPAAVALLLGTPTSLRQRALMGWLGIRGIGSLYYLSYAFNHGLSGPPAGVFAALVISVVALSICVHGASAQPLLARYEATLERSRGGAQDGGSAAR
jgi:NhaP-type Na+/H+ or K+/H+ antiporter